MQNFQNKTIIITGASSGIGRATALLLAQAGANLVLNSRGPEQLDKIANEVRALGGNAVTVVGDVQEEAIARELVNTATEHFGGLDAAFNNAGTLGALGSVTTMTDEDWQSTLNINLTSAFYAAKYQIPAMQARGKGSIVFTGTFVGYTAGVATTAAYAASKSGLIGLTQVLAAELGQDAIRVNCLLPGGTDTPMGRIIVNSPDALAYVKNLHALQRIASPQEIAEVAAFLLSDSASFITGSALLADGGVSIYKP